MDRVYYILSLLVAGVGLCGCSDQGHDLYFVAPQFVNEIVVTIDFENGASPKEVEGLDGRRTYAIKLDHEGKATINGVWPFRWHRTFIKTPQDGLLQSPGGFEITESDVIRGFRMERTAKGVTKSVSTVDGSVYHYKVKKGKDE